MKINVDKEDAMLETVERIIERCLGCNAGEIRKSEKITNNFVYSFAVADDHYFLKLYRSKEWPEAGKIPFVYQSLARKNIPCAELIAYERDDETYPNGYLIEREIRGTAADKMRLTREQETRLYAQLAELVSSVHGVHIENYGYIGDGIACYGGMTDFLEDEFDGFDDKLKDILSEAQMKKLRAQVLGVTYDFAGLPSVLCHGDLSKKNVIVRDDEITLIDWDDAMALNWMADVSRLTFWMKQSYNEQEYASFRNMFLEHYRTPYRKAEFDVFESAWHIYSALDSLVFSMRVGDKEMEKRLRRYLDEIC